jgi:hypothetical protein
MVLTELYSSTTMKRMLFVSGIIISFSSPGVHVLRDARTNMYNFDPYLQKITQPEEFDFSLLNEFLPASKDKVQTAIFATRK